VRLVPFPPSEMAINGGDFPPSLSLHNVCDLFFLCGCSRLIFSRYDEASIRSAPFALAPLPQTLPANF